MRLRQQQVEKPPPPPGRAFDQLQIFRAKDHDPQHAEVIGQFADGSCVEAQFPLRRGPIHFDFVPALADDAGADEVTRLSVPDHLCATDAAKRAQRREEIDCLENVGLALRVEAEQQVKTGREIDVQPRVIAEITKSQMAQMHGEELLALPGDVKPQSVAGKRGLSGVTA